MIAVDSNILVHAHRADSPWHDAALKALVGLAESGRPWAIPWPCAHEFYAIVTHPRIYLPPSPPALALRSIRAWTASPALRFIGEGVRHWRALSELVEAARIAGPRVHDARIAAICMTQGVTVLWTADRDFSRFPKLKTFNPLVA